MPAELQLQVPVYCGFESHHRNSGVAELVDARNVLQKLVVRSETIQAECRWDYIVEPDTRPKGAVGLAPTCPPDPN